MENIVIKKSGIQGVGVFANKDFNVGDEVYRFPKGRFIKKDQLFLLSGEEKDHLDVVDAGTYELMEAPGCFVNHSCDPNVMEKDRVGYAWKPIKKGDELMVDYRIRAYDDWELECKCGSKICIGVVKGNFFTLPENLQKKYFLYAPKFIQEEYKKINIVHDDYH